MGNRGEDYTVIGLFDHRSTELLVAGVVEGRIEIANMEPRSGGYERVYYHVKAIDAEMAERWVLREVDHS